jgi:[protein-PII] uridylyltransferase
VTMTPNNGSSAELLPKVETTQVSALAEHRQALRQRLLDGASGADLMATLTEFVDGLVRDRYKSAMRQAGEGAQVAGAQHCCLVALGGYGLRELAPYSDIDIMFLYSEEAGEAAPVLFREVLHHLWDLGFHVGHSMRTIHDCIELAGQDLTIRTSMMTARFLAGSPNLFQKFHRLYAKEIVGRGAARFIEQKKEERQREYVKFGETIYLLEPNVKKSKGGLRDFHLLRWVGMARFQAATLQDLADRSLLSRQDFLAVSEARDFLWRVRAFLHVGAGRAQEILSFDEQVRLASLYGFEDRPHLLGVEQFMQQYYRHTMGLHEIMLRFVDRCQAMPAKRRSLRTLPAAVVDGYFVVIGRHLLTVPSELRARVLDSPDLLLRLFDMARSRRLKIEADLLDEIHSHMDSVSSEAFRTPEVSRVFLKILAGPGAVAGTLQAMHCAHLLEKLIPVFASLRGLMQFNQYHKYTVDEHTLLAVAKAEALALESDLIGEVYQEIRRKDLLHLAILLHDLGKGRKEDHCEVGKGIAEETAARLGCDEQDTRALVFLVHKHLLMANTAFRRDPFDEKVFVPFGKEVGSPEVLRMLLVLTVADIAAVGPGVLTKWKESLLTQLYLRTLPAVLGEQDKTIGPECLKELVNEVAREFTNAEAGELEWIESQLTKFPQRYLHGTPPKRIAAHLGAIRRLQAGDVLVEETFNEELGMCEYTVITHDNLTPGIFSKMAGAMAAAGLDILDAQIITRDDGIVVNTFQASDPDYVGVPPEDRRTSVAETIALVLKGEEEVERLMRQNTRLSAVHQLPATRHATEVEIDNGIGDRFTVIDVFADDTQGLLYVITRAIFRLDLSVHAARISTRLDDDIQQSLRTIGRHQVVDVFYVTDRDGGKIEDHARLDVIRSTIMQDIDLFMGQAVDEPEDVSTGTPS